MTIEQESTVLLAEYSERFKPVIEPPVPVDEIIRLQPPDRVKLRRLG